MKLRKILLPLLILAGSILFVATSSEATLVFSADDFTATTGGQTVTIQVRVWGPAYTAGEVAAGTIPNAAGAIVGSTFYTYAYRLNYTGGAGDEIDRFRLTLRGDAIGVGSTTNAGGSGTAPTAQTTTGGYFTNTFGTTIAPGGTSQWMWLTSNSEPSLPSGFSSTNNSVGGQPGQTRWGTAGMVATNLPAPNPEPATSLLFSTGLGGLAFWRRKQVGSWLKSRLRRQPHSPSPEGPDQA
jgi:hypothetical protein